jgi:hypothetical protein
MSKSAGEGRINVRRTVAASTNLTTIQGLPPRRASQLAITNANDAAAETAVFDGADGVDVTLTVAALTTVVLDGDFASLGALGTNVTVVVGWVDDGTLPPNP